ncbi:hypothetical protein FOZ63_002252, partial [Perkinsus olseni]
CGPARSAITTTSAFRHDRQNQGEMIDHAEKFLKLMNTRRSIRFYSKEDVPLSVVMTAVRTACTAPSGAHLQPWTFVIVQNQQAKERIRDVVEREEQLNYDRRMRRSWVKDVTPMVGDLHRDGRVAKPYLSEAPYLIVMMKQNYRLDASTGERQEHYYVEQSCGIAAGMLICALHNAGLVTLTSTPMGAESAIRNILNRPANEKVYLLMPVGYPSSDATVPDRPIQMYVDKVLEAIVEKQKSKVLIQGMGGACGRIAERVAKYALRRLPSGHGFRYTVETREGDAAARPQDFILEFDPEAGTDVLRRAPEDDVDASFTPPEITLFKVTEFGPRLKISTAAAQRLGQSPRAGWIYKSEVENPQELAGMPPMLCSVVVNGADQPSLPDSPTAVALVDPKKTVVYGRIIDLDP